MTMPSPAFHHRVERIGRRQHPELWHQQGEASMDPPCDFPFFIFHLAAVARGSMSLKPGARSSFRSST